MALLETKHKRKSAAITVIILLLLLFVIFNYGMQYLDPPEEYGLAINFGDANVGSGEAVEKTKKIVTPTAVKKQEVVEEVVEEEVKETPKETLKEEIITDNSLKEAPVLEKPKEVIKPVKKEIKKEIPKPKPSKETTDALNSLLNGNASDGNPKSEGDDEKVGVKGDVKGDPNANTYYGNEGSGSGGNDNLAGRKLLLKPKPKQECQEEGTVVVIITIDKNGNVIHAIPVIKGSTNSTDCLLKSAKEAALKAKWSKSNKASSVYQTGTIIYEFSLN